MRLGSRVESGNEAPVNQPDLCMSTDTPDLFRYAQSSVFMVKFLGHLGNEQGQRGAESRQWEVLEIIDAAQVRNTPPQEHYMIVTSAMNTSYIFAATRSVAVGNIRPRPTDPLTFQIWYQGNRREQTTGLCPPRPPLHH